MRLAAAGLVLCTVLLWQVSVSADEETAEKEWAPLSAGPITTWSAPMVGKGKLVIQPSALYTHTRGSFNDDGHYEALSNGNKKSFFQEQFFSQYGITENWEIDAQTVYQENYVTQDGAKAHARGLADSFLFTRYELFEEKGWLPEATGLLQLKLPTGKYQHGELDKLSSDLMGTGSWDPGVGIIMTKRMKPFLIHADAIMNFPQHVRVDGDKTQYANYLNCDAAVEYFLPRGFNLMAEVNGLFQGDKKINGEKKPASDTESLTFSPGIGWSNDRIQTLIAYQRTILGTNVDANDSIVATFVYTF
ncbi:MAG: transporter [Candidatus Omnitrophica bacterium]|nr:transporter [Candidatus Omnitrophota bacterium]